MIKYIMSGLDICVVFDANMLFIFYSAPIRASSFLQRIHSYDID